VTVPLCEMYKNKVYMALGLVPLLNWPKTINLLVLVLDSSHGIGRWGTRNAVLERPKGRQFRPRWTPAKLLIGWIGICCHDLG
jgi:hypothetical protein